MKEKIKEWAKKLTWEDYALIAIIAIILIIQIIMISQFQHLPGPMFGGDVYRERGFIQSILNGVPFWESPYSIGEYAFFPWLSYLVAAFFVKMLGLTLDNAMHLIAIASTLFSMIGVYFLGKRLFHNKLTALMMPIIFIVMRGLYDKTTMGLAVIFMIWALYFLITYLESKKLLHQILAGVLLGCVGLSHGSMFINACIMFGTVILLNFLFDVYPHRKNFMTSLKVVADYFKRFYLMILSAVIVSIAFFMPLFLKYRFHVLNNSLAYALTNVDNISFFDIMSAFFKIFFDFSSLISAVVGLIILVGFVVAIFNIKKTEYRAIIAIFLGVIVATFHFLITKPLFNRWMEPWHVFGEVWVGKILLLTLGLVVIIQLMCKYLKFQKVLAYGIVFLVVLAPAFAHTYTIINQDRWIQYGKTMDQYTQSLYDLGSWLEKNTKNDESILTNDESAFMINAMSGERVVFSRRVHASYFDDVDKRYADGVVMLFGNNSDMTRKLLKEYNVKYVYLDQYMFSSPIIVNTKYKEYLESNGINFTIEMVRWDPSTNEAEKFESLVVYPTPDSALFRFANNASASESMIMMAQPFYVNNNVAHAIYLVK